MRKHGGRALLAGYHRYHVMTHYGLVTLAEEVACCLMPPRHYLNQCWFLISNSQGQKTNFLYQEQVVYLSRNIIQTHFFSSYPRVNNVSWIWTIVTGVTSDVSVPSQSGTKPNLVAKFWLPNLVAFCDIHNALKNMFSMCVMILQWNIMDRWFSMIDIWALKHLEGYQLW